MRIKKNETLDLIDSYKNIQADIAEIEFKLEKDEGNKDLLDKKQELTLKIKRINNALTILSDEEREVIEIAHIQRKKYYVVVEKLNLSYQRIKQLERAASEKMKPYVFG